MKYFILKESLDPKKRGRVSFPLEVVNNFSIDDPDNIFNAYGLFEEIKREVKIPVTKLRKKSAKFTDMHSVIGNGFIYRNLISTNLKNALERSKHLGYQFLPARVFNFESTLEWQYWLTNVFIFFPEYIDFPNTELWLTRPAGDKIERVYCESYENFERKKKIHAPVRIGIFQFGLKEQEIEYDLFAIDQHESGIVHCISEKLKNEIEALGCSGLTFEEIKTPSAHQI